MIEGALLMIWIGIDHFPELRHVRNMATAMLRAALYPEEQSNG